MNEKHSRCYLCRGDRPVPAAVFGFRGAGIDGGYWFVALASACALAVQWLGWRGKRLAAEWLLLGWFGLIAAGSIYLAVTAPESFRFRGDTLGLDF